jgi:hypothetical protein
VKEDKPGKPISKEPERVENQLLYETPRAKEPKAGMGGQLDIWNCTATSVGNENLSGKMGGTPPG